MAEKDCVVRNAVIAAGAPSSGVIDVRDMLGGVIKNIGTNWTAADIVFDVCEKADGTFTTLEDEYGVAFRITGLAIDAANAHRIPLGVFPVHFLKLRSVTVGSVTSANQTNAQTLVLMLKD